MMLQRVVGRICNYVICEFCLPHFLAGRRCSSLDDAEEIQALIFACSQLLLLHVLRSNLFSVDRRNEFV